MTRSCLLCGEMICGCGIHTTAWTLRALYGLCGACTAGLSRRLGEVVVDVDAETRTAVRLGDYRKSLRVQAELERLKRA